MVLEDSIKMREVNFLNSYRNVGFSIVWCLRSFSIREFCIRVVGREGNFNLNRGVLVKRV